MILESTAETEGMSVSETKPDNDQQKDQQQRSERPRVKGIICTGGMRFTAKWLIAEASYAPENWIVLGDGKLHVILI